MKPKGPHKIGRGFIKDGQRPLSLNLRAARVELGLTQRQVAEMLGLKWESTYGAWEEDRATPNPEQLAKVFSLLKVENPIAFITSQLVIKADSVTC